MDPPGHLQMAKAQELLKQGIRHQNFTLELHQVQVLPHSLLIHLRTLLYVQHVVKVTTGAEIVLMTIFVTFVGSPPTLPICVELLNVDPDHQSVYTVVMSEPSLSLPGFSPNYMSEPSLQIYARRALGEYRCATNRVSHTIKS